MTAAKATAGAYDATENILHLWFPQRVELADEESVRKFLDGCCTVETVLDICGIRDQALSILASLLQLGAIELRDR